MVNLIILKLINQPVMNNILQTEIIEQVQFLEHWFKSRFYGETVINNYENGQPQVSFRWRTTNISLTTSKGEFGGSAVSDMITLIKELYAEFAFDDPNHTPPPLSKISFQLQDLWQSHFSQSYFIDPNIPHHLFLGSHEYVTLAGLVQKYKNRSAIIVIEIFL